MYYILFENSEVADMYIFLTNDPNMHIRPEFPSGYTVRQEDILTILKMNMAYNGTLPS